MRVIHALAVTVTLVGTVSIVTAEPSNNRNFWPGAEASLVTFVDTGGSESQVEKSELKKSELKKSKIKHVWQRCCKPRVYGRVETVYYDRENHFRDQPLVIDGFDETALLGTRDLNFDYEPGVRVLLGIGKGPCCHCSSWELSYLGLFDQDASNVVLGNDNLSVPGQLGFLNPFATADRIGVDLSSQLHTFEVNCVKCVYRCEWQVEFLAGFRYLSLDEDLNIEAFDDVEDGTGHVRVRTDNDLFGVQIGGRVKRYHTCRFAWELLGKAGIYGNSARQQQRVTLFPPFDVVDAEREKGAVSFVGELGLSLVYDLGPRWSLRGGYNLLWVQGLALAPDQLDFNVAQAGAGTNLDSGGGVFLHGVTVGLEARF